MTENKTNVIPTVVGDVAEELKRMWWYFKVYKVTST